MQTSTSVLMNSSFFFNVTQFPEKNYRRNQVLKKSKFPQVIIFGTNFKHIQYFTLYWNNTKHQD